MQISANDVCDLYNGLLVQHEHANVLVVRIAIIIGCQGWRSRAKSSTSTVCSIINSWAVLVLQDIESTNKTRSTRYVSRV